LVFSFISAILLRPLPYPDPDRIVLLGQREKEQPGLAFLSLVSAPSIWADYREQSSTLSEWAAWSPRTMGLSEGDRSIPVEAGRVTSSFFRLLGASTVRGRLFTDAEGVQGGPRVVVLSWEYWQNSSGETGDPVGRVLTLDGEPHEVIGVLAEDFDFILGSNIRVWVPLREDPYRTPRYWRSIVSLARMAPGTTMAQVEAEVAQIAGRIEVEHPESFRGWTMDAINLGTEFPDRQSRTMMWMLQGVVLFVLLIVCVNIIGLLLARSHDRRREIAVRVALGAGPLRIVRQLIQESLFMVAIGGATGLALAAVGIRLSAGRMGGGTHFEPAMEANVILFSLGITVLCSLAFGLFPALQSFSRSLVEALKEGAGGGSAGGRRRGWLSAGLVVVQIAVSLVALGGGSVMARSFLDVRDWDPGFDMRNLAVVDFTLPLWKYPTTTETGALMDEIERRATDLPGVATAALVTPMPKTLLVPRDTFRISGRRLDDGMPAPRAVSVRASPQYRETLGIPLLQGRFFDDSDGVGAAPVAVVNKALVDLHFGGRSPLGERVVFRGESREIVGVVANVQQSLFPRYDETIHIPMAQSPRSGFLMLRTLGEFEGLAEAIRSEIRTVDPDVAIVTVQTMEEIARSGLMSPVGVFVPILGGFGILALLIASLGTYGLVAHAVGERTREIGVRLAVGAQPAGVVAMIVKYGLGMSVMGLMLGGILLYMGVVVMQRTLSNFVGMAPIDPLTLVGAAVVLFAATLLACVLPAVRAATVDPVRVLKAE